MARLDQMPELSVILTLKKTLDFYVWKGITVCRLWPRKATYQPSAQELASRQTFGQNIQALGQMPAAIIQQTMPQIQTNGWTWRDAWVSGIYGKNQEWP